MWVWVLFMVPLGQALRLLFEYLLLLYKAMEILGHIIIIICSVLHY